MNKYTCRGFNSVKAENMSEAAEVFANRVAKHKYGRKGYCRTCNMGSHSQDGRMAEYSAFVGYKTGQNETTGENINFTVWVG